MQGKIKRKQWSIRANQAKERKRLESDSPDYPIELPQLRRKIVITDYDFGEITMIVEMERSKRVDCYNVRIDGKFWKQKVGWSNILAEIRKRYLRVKSIK